MHRRTGVGGSAAILVLVMAAPAAADPGAVVQVAVPGYAEAPAARALPPLEEIDERRPSPFRLSVGPVAATTGRGLGAGLGVAADLGTGTLGARLSAAWLRGEASSAAPSPIGGGLAQYTAEVTVDLARRGALHPVLGLGLGLAHAQGPAGAGDLGIGTARVGLEYWLSLADADVRLSAGALGALPGPASDAVADVRGWALVGGSVVIGF